MIQCISYLLTCFKLINRTEKDNKMKERAIKDNADDNGWGFYVILDIEDIRPFYMQRPFYKDCHNKYKYRYMQHRLSTIKENIEERENEKEKGKEKKIIMASNLQLSSYLILTIIIICSAFLILEKLSSC